jgi:uncharacterized lipoprotein YmbA
MMRRMATPVVLLGLACFAMAGCVSLGPKADPTRFFTLTPLPQVERTTGGSSSDSAQVALGVGPIKLPGYLDREQLVTRISQNRFAVSENDRWAEPLEDNFALVLSQDLSAILSSDKVTQYPWPTNRRPRYQVEIDVLRFEADTAHTAHLIARWILRDLATKETLNVRESGLAEPVNEATTEASVAALSELLGAFSQQIAEALRTLDGSQ